MKNMRARIIKICIEKNALPYGEQNGAHCAPFCNSNYDMIKIILPVPKSCFTMPIPVIPKGP
jgi:hypothetical protein